MINTPAPLDPIAQLVTKYQSNGHQTTAPEPQPALQKKKSWAGFAERTLWDWLNLLGVLLVPLMIGAGTILITAQQSAISQSQHDSDQRIASSQRDSDQKIADNQFQEALLKTFRDDINRLVFDQHLLTAKYNDPVQIVAQSYTNDALRKLDLSRRILLVQFLSDLQLITTSSTENLPLLSLYEANLQGAYLAGANLQGAYLFKANLAGANLQGTHLFKASLQGANLQGAYLVGTDLQGSHMFLSNLQGAELERAELERASLQGVNLQRANLQGAYLEGANLDGTEVTPEQLAKAHTLKDAILPDGSRYPSTSYPIPNHQEPKNGTNTATNLP